MTETLVSRDRGFDDAHKVTFCRFHQFRPSFQSRPRDARTYGRVHVDRLVLRCRSPRRTVQSRAFTAFPRLITGKFIKQTEEANRLRSIEWKKELRGEKSMRANEFFGERKERFPKEFSRINETSIFFFFFFFQVK